MIIYTVGFGVQYMIRLFNTTDADWSQRTSIRNSSLSDRCGAHLPPCLKPRTHLNASLNKLMFVTFITLHTAQHRRLNIMCSSLVPRRLIQMRYCLYKWAIKFSSRQMLMWYVDSYLMILAEWRYAIWIIYFLSFFKNFDLIFANFNILSYLWLSIEEKVVILSLVSEGRSLLYECEK